MAKDRKFDAQAVALDDLAAVVGNYEVCGYWTRKIGAEIVEDWQGRPALRVADARRVVEVCRADRATHEANLEAYQAFLRDCKEQARQAREKELAQKREAVQQAQDASRRRIAERALRDREAQLAEAAALENARRKPTFEEWKAART